MGKSGGGEILGGRMREKEGGLVKSASSKREMLAGPAKAKGPRPLETRLLEQDLFFSSLSTL